jgi:peptidoglycan/LPS O-acetylase OafA/YrhL
MQSPNRVYVRELDELRGIAAMLVFVYHSLHNGLSTVGRTGWIVDGPPLFFVLAEGHTGVSLFMVLSGFVLASGVLGRSVNYSQFMKNRALRILPLMVFVLIFGLYGSEGFDLGRALAPFIFLANTPLRFEDATHLSGTVWTISVEFQFYLIAPFLFAFVSREGFRFLGPAIVLLLLFRLIVVYPHLQSPAKLQYILHYSIVGRLGQFLIGVALAYIWQGVAISDRTRRWGFAVLALSATGMGVVLYGLNASGGFYSWRVWRLVLPEVEGLLWAGVIAGYVIARPTSHLGRLLASVGVLSYSIYLLHWPLQVIFWRLYRALGLDLVASFSGVLVLTLVILAPAVLAMAALSYHCIERPFLALRGRYVPAAAPVAERSRRAA